MSEVARNASAAELARAAARVAARARTLRALDPGAADAAALLGQALEKVRDAEDRIRSLRVPRRRKFSHEEAIRMATQEVSVAEVARRLGVSRRSVQAVLHAAGMHPGPTPGVNAPTRFDRVECAMLYRAGATIGELEARYRTSDRQVRAALAAQGVEVRRGGRRPARPPSSVLEALVKRREG